MREENKRMQSQAKLDHESYDAGNIERLVSEFSIQKFEALVILGHAYLRKNSYRNIRIT